MENNTWSPCYPTWSSHREFIMIKTSLKDNQWHKGGRWGDMIRVISRHDGVKGAGPGVYLIWPQSLQVRPRSPDIQSRPRQTGWHLAMPWSHDNDIIMTSCDMCHNCCLQEPTGVSDNAVIMISARNISAASWGGGWQGLYSYGKFVSWPNYDYSVDMVNRFVIEKGQIQQYCIYWLWILNVPFRILAKGNRKIWQRIWIVNFCNLQKVTRPFFKGTHSINSKKYVDI